MTQNQNILEKENWALKLVENYLKNKNPIT
jgi:hypothetical protein